MLRALGKKKSSSGDAGSVATTKSDSGASSSNRNRRRSRSPFRRVRGRSRSKSRDRKSSKRKDKHKGAVSRAAAVQEANAKIGIASPEPTLGRTVHGRLSSPPSAASTACSSMGSSMSPYEQDDDDAFLLMQTEKYNKMINGGASAPPAIAAAKSVISLPGSTISTSNVDIVNASVNTSISRGAPQDSIGTTARSMYFSTSRSSSRLKTSSFGTIVEEEEEDIEEEERSTKRSVTFRSDNSVNDENTVAVPAPSPDRFLHRPTADETMRSPSARVTFAGDDGGRPTSPFQRPGQNRIFLLLLEPNKKVFELIQVEYDAQTATIGYILGLIKLHASEKSLLRQKHVGLIRPRDDMELTDLTMLATSQGRIKHGEVLIPLPEDCRSSKCRRLAKTILKTPNVVKLLSKEQPLASRTRRRSKSRSRRSVSPGRRGTNAHADEAARRAALEEASRAATKALEDKIAQLEKRLADVANSSSSQSGNNSELSDKIRLEIEKKAKAREELEDQMKKGAEMSAAERIEQMAREAEKSAASEKPSLRSQNVRPMSFSFESEKVEESSGIAAAMESVSDMLADGIKNVKPKLRRVRNTIRSVKKKIRHSKNKAVVAASVGMLLVSFFYGFFGGSTSRGDLTIEEEPTSMIHSSSLPYAIIGLILGGSALLFFANKLTKTTGRSRRSSTLRSSSRKKGRLLRGASNIRSANNMRYGPR